MRSKWLGALGVVAGLVVAVAVVWAVSAPETETRVGLGAQSEPTPRASVPDLVDELAGIAEPPQEPGVTDAGEAFVDPDRYAAHVAGLLFSRDTRTADVDDLRGELLAEADPGLTESGLADLVRTIGARIPSADAWGRMRANQQWSEWHMQSIWEPAAWQEAVTSGYAEPGWTMRTVNGIEVTHYAERGEERTSSAERTISLIMRCPTPDAPVDRCRLALLSTTPLA